jgi:hypothetical protein
MVVVGKRYIGTGVDAGAATAVYVVDNAAGADDNPLVVVVENAAARTRAAVLVHGDTSHTRADAAAAVAGAGAIEGAVVVGANEGGDRPSPHVVDVVPRNTHPVGAAFDIPSRASPSRTIHPGVNPEPPMLTANPSSSDYETHGLGLVAPAVGLDGVMILMILKTTLKVVVVVVMVVLVQSASVTILDDAVLEAVVEVDMMVPDDAALKVVVKVDVMRVLGDAVKESVEVAVTETADAASAVGRAMQVVYGRVVAVVVVRTMIRRRSYHHH